VDPARAISDFGALIFLAAGAVTALAYLARRYEARLLSEGEFLRASNTTLASGMERLAEESKVVRADLAGVREDLKIVREELRTLRERDR
jgi:uncharacterized protein YaaQ